MVYAAHRQGRTFLPPRSTAPCARAGKGLPTEIPFPSFQVAVFENRFPSFVEEAPPLPRGFPCPRGGPWGGARWWSTPPPTREASPPSRRRKGSFWPGRGGTGTRPSTPFPGCASSCPLRIGERRWGSPSTTPTARSTPTPSCRPSWSGKARPSGRGPCSLGFSRALGPTWWTRRRASSPSSPLRPLPL